jgi:hypothetical protein
VPRSVFSISRLGSPSSLALVLALGAFLAAIALGCASQQAPDASATAPPAAIASQPAAAGGSPPVASDVSSLRPLPFKGRLVSGNPDQLPPIVAMSLSSNSPVTFSYREELTHEERHTPMILSAIENLTFAPFPTGEFGVTASASLSIMNGSQPIGDYTAQARITRPYGMYSQPTHKELDDAARAAVRSEIDRKLEAESAHLAASVGETE